jgi:hypothetical protein
LGFVGRRTGGAKDGCRELTESVRRDLHALFSPLASDRTARAGSA